MFFDEQKQCGFEWIYQGLPRVTIDYKFDQILRGILKCSVKIWLGNG